MYLPNPRRRRLLGRLALSTALVAGLVALSPVARAQHSADQVTITYWNQWTDPVSKVGVTSAIAAFQKAYPNIHVQEVDISSDTKILTAITGGKPPDAATMFNIRNLGPYASRGAVQNLDALAKTYHTDLADYAPAALNAGTYKGHLYGLTVELDSFALLVNTDLFRAAGIKAYPQTMSQVAADAVALTKKDASGRITQAGIVTGYNASMIGFTFPYFNVSWYDPKTNMITANTPNAVQALTWEQNLVARMGVQPYENFLASKARNPLGDHFIDGTVGMDFDGDWACNLIPGYNKNLHWVAIAPPYADGHPEWKNSTWVDGGINIIPTGAAHPNEAYQFINFMNTTQVNVMANKAIGGRSPLKSGGALQQKQGNACIGLFTNLLQGQRAFPWPVTAVSYDLQTGVGTAADSVIRGKDTPAHALGQLQQKIQGELSAAR